MFAAPGPDGRPMLFGYDDLISVVAVSSGHQLRYRLPGGGEGTHVVHRHGRRPASRAPA